MKKALHAAAFGAILFAAASAQAYVVDVQFGTSSAQTGAAVIGNTGDVWNATSGGTQSDVSLVNTSGSASGLDVSFSSAQSYTSDPSYTQFTGTPYANLMQSYLVGRVGSSAISIDLSGFSAGEQYGFYVYTQGDDNSPNRSISISANGTFEATTTQSNASSFTSGDNYAYFVATANSQGDIDLSGKVLNGEGNINGLQIVSGVPEPTSTLLLSIGLLAFGATRLRRRAAAQ